MTVMTGWGIGWTNGEISLIVRGLYHTRPSHYVNPQILTSGGFQ
jgi:hypothetical protein